MAESRTSEGKEHNRGISISQSVFVFWETRRGLYQNIDILADGSLGMGFHNLFDCSSWVKLLTRHLDARQCKVSGLWSLLASLSSQPC